MSLVELTELVVSLVELTELVVSLDQLINIGCVLGYIGDEWVLW